MGDESSGSIISESYQEGTDYMKNLKNFDNEDTFKNNQLGSLEKWTFLNQIGVRVGWTTKATKTIPNWSNSAYLEAMENVIHHGVSEEIDLGALVGDNDSSLGIDVMRQKSYYKAGEKSATLFESKLKPFKEDKEEEKGDTNNSIKKKVEFTNKGDSPILESENNKESKIDMVSVGSSAQNTSSLGTSANDKVEKQIDDKKNRKKTIVVDVGSVSGEKEQELHFKIRRGS